MGPQRSLTTVGIGLALILGMAAFPADLFAGTGTSVTASSDAKVGSPEWRENLRNRHAERMRDIRERHQAKEETEMGERTGDTGTRATASASAKASAGARAGREGECLAQSESSAEARSGDEVVRDSDRDMQTARGEDCAAEARSEASARSGSPREKRSDDR